MSSSMSSMIPMVRLGVLGTVTFFSLIVLGLSAHMVSVVSQAGLVWVFAALNVAVSALTIVTVVPLLVLGMIRKGALPTFIVVEIAVLGVLWILWIAAAGRSADSLIFLPSTCDFAFTAGTGSFSCHEPQAAQAFAWLNWLLLSAYVTLLLVLSLIQHTRGNPVWNKSVNEVDLFAPKVFVEQQQPQMYAPAPGVYAPAQPYAGTPPQGNYPPQAQYAAPTPPQGSYGVPTPPPQQPAPTGYPQV